MLDSKLVIGIDEAGYGPSMGPLVVCGTAWRVPLDFAVDDMSKLLDPEFQAKPLRVHSSHIPIGDSKKIHKESLGTFSLQFGVDFLMHQLAGKQVIEPDSKLEWIAREDLLRLKQVAWYANALSTATEIAKSPVRDFEEYVGAASRKLEAHSLKLVGVQARILDEPEFNRQIDITQNKSTTLSETSLALVRSLITECGIGNELAEVYCDKHGGRNRYQAVLSHCFDQEWFTTQVEGRACSRYVGNWQGHRMQIQFKVEGDSIFPSAAASVVAKWTREHLMERLNHFWWSQSTAAEQAIFQPTAGYYVDAVRFAQQIEKVAKRLGLPQETWWRKK